MPPQPKRISILALFGARAYFGQERANIEALVALQNQGCEVVCLVRPEAWTADFAEKLKARGLRVLKVPFVDFPTRKYLWEPIVTFLPRMIRGNYATMRYLHQNEVTHFHVFNQQYAVSFFPTLYFGRQAIVYRAGDQPVMHRAIYRSIWSFLKKRVSIFVADTAFIKNSLEETGIPPNKITVLYAPPPKRLVAGLNTGLRTKPDEIRFAYVGQVTEAKGVGHLVEAFRIVSRSWSRARLLIVGGTDERDPWQRELIRTIHESDHLKDRVDLLGFIEDVPQVLACCHVHVAPTLGDEPYGLVVVEAKSAGLPSIIYESGGMTELITDGVDGVVCRTKSPAALAEVLAGYCSAPERIAREGEAARASLARFRFDEFETQWLEIYAAAAGPGALAAGPS